MLFFICLFFFFYNYLFSIILDRPVCFFRERNVLAKKALRKIWQKTD